MKKSGRRNRGRFVTKEKMHPANIAMGKGETVLSEK